MVKIIIILSLLQYVYNFIFGYKSNILSCGIFGMATDNPLTLDVSGVHILGIYNIERGKMSCGLSWDGDVQYGLNHDKLYTDFIVNRDINPVKTPIMIGHTRQPSYGMAITKDNAHPFGFGTSNDGEGYEMIFCHNGTLKNHKDLALKYNIELNEKIKTFGHSGHVFESTRIKIDSEILGEILYRTKTFHVLSEYVGAAALAWTWVDEPNKLYLWSGKSKHTVGTNSIIETEERPMNVFCRDGNSMFFSSLTDPLTVLGADKRDQLQIDYNTVYIITDGDFNNAEKHKVSRLQAGQNEETVYNGYHHHNYAGFGKSYLNDSYCDFDEVNGRNFNKPVVKKSTNSINLHDEVVIDRVSYGSDRVYFKSLRYWKNGSLLSGIYIYIKDWGFKFCGDDSDNAERFLTNIEGLPFNYTAGCFNYKNDIVDGFVPVKQNKDIQFHYFINGVLLKSHIDYKRALKLKEASTFPAKHVSYNTLSYMSKHPVIDIDDKSTLPIAILDGNYFTGNIANLGSKKTYYFDKGLLTKWNRRDDNKPVIILPVKNVPVATTSTVAVVSNDVLEDELLEDELFVKELLIESFGKHSEDVSETILELGDWKEHDLVKGALETLKLINHTLKDFVETPNKKK